MQLSDLRQSPASSEPSPPLERDASNFDFRVVTLLLVLITRQDLLKEYLDDGIEKDACNVPDALRNPTKWKTLRTLFEPCMLADMLYLWELPKTLASALHLRKVFQVMINLDQYDLESCPNSRYVRGIIEYSRQQTAELSAAGVASDEGEEN